MESCNVQFPDNHRPPQVCEAMRKMSTEQGSNQFQLKREILCQYIQSDFFIMINETLMITSKDRMGVGKDQRDDDEQCVKVSCRCGQAWLTWRY